MMTIERATKVQLDREIAQALVGPEWLVIRKKERVDPKAFAKLIKEAVKFPEFKSPSRYTWDLIRDVPIHYLDPGSRDDYETDPDSSDEEIDENLTRYDRVAALLTRRKKKPWPIVVNQDGAVIDGYHRLAVLADHEIADVDVLWARPRSKRR